MPGTNFCETKAHMPPVCPRRPSTHSVPHSHVPQAHIPPPTWNRQEAPPHTSCRIFPLGGHISGECSYRTELSEQKGGAGREPYPSPELPPPGWGRTETAGNAGEGPGLDAEASPATADLLRVKSGEVPEPEIPSVTPPCPSFICSPAMVSPMPADPQL